MKGDYLLRDTMSQHFHVMAHIRSPVQTFVCVHTVRWGQYLPCDPLGRGQTTWQQPPGCASRCQCWVSPWREARRVDPEGAPGTPRSATRRWNASAGTLWRRSWRGRGSSGERRDGCRCSSLQWCSSPGTGNTATWGPSWVAGRRPAPCPGWSPHSEWSARREQNY